MKRTRIVGALALLGIGLGAAWLRRRRELARARGRTVLVTGGSRGLGLALARRFAQLGANVAVCARDEQELERARQQLAAEGLSVSTWRCDVTDADRVRLMVHRVESTLGPIEVLVNNAGILHVGPTESITTADLRYALDLHVWGTVHAVEAVLPGMRARRRGRIVNVASVNGLVAMPWMLPYSLSKSALLGYSAGLRVELANDGITVTAVTPWLMRTGGFLHAVFKGASRQRALAIVALAAALPLLGVDADRAAAKIVRGVLAGRTQVPVGWQARVLLRLQALAPRMLASALSLVDRALPRSATSAGETGIALAAELGPRTRALVERALAGHNQPKIRARG
jgi:short-subunit dehydrogenase